MCLSILFTAPDTPPVEVSVTTLSSSSVLISWNPPFVPNGEVTHYTLYVTFGEETEPLAFHTASSATVYTINHLQPYQLVSVEISAHTDAGEGPKSATVQGRTSEEGIQL